MKALPRNHILVGDALTRLRQLPQASVDCIITSPPYFAQRNYGTDGQLGAGADVTSWVTELRAVCRELARVLAPHGSLWLNVGDGYSPHPKFGASKKSLLGGPERLLLALIADGWIVRNKVVWAKTNPMPSSISDRLTTTHETLYFLARATTYFFDLDAIRVPLTSRTQTASGSTRTEYLPSTAVPTGRAAWTKTDNRGLSALKTAGISGHPLGKNPGDVWQLSTAGFRGAHFATFPAHLVERPLLATCPEKICTSCDSPWRRDPVDRASPVPSLGNMSPSCTCDAATRPGLVLDPFFGSGTVGMVAEKHGRDWLGIELNPAYAEMARERIVETQSLPQPEPPQPKPMYTRRLCVLAA